MVNWEAKIIIQDGELVLRLEHELQETSQGRGDVEL